MEKFCKNCGTSMNEAERFCPNCGTDNGADMGGNPNMQQQPNMNYNQQPNYNGQPNMNYGPQQNMNYGPQQNMNYNGVAQDKYNPFAIASFVCSIVGIFLFGLIMGILSVIFAVVAKNRAKTFPNEKGRGLATAGLVIGIIEIIIMVWVMITASAIISSYTKLF